MPQSVIYLGADSGHCVCRCQRDPAVTNHDFSMSVGYQQPDWSHKLYPKLHQTIS